MEGRVEGGEVQGARRGQAGRDRAQRVFLQRIVTLIPNSGLESQRRESLEEGVGVLKRICKPAKAIDLGLLGG